MKTRFWAKFCPPIFLDLGSYQLFSENSSDLGHYFFQTLTLKFSQCGQLGPLVGVYGVLCWYAGSRCGYGRPLDAFEKGQELCASVHRGVCRGHSGYSRQSTCDQGKGVALGVGYALYLPDATSYPSCTLPAVAGCMQGRGEGWGKRKMSSPPPSNYLIAP